MNDVAEEIQSFLAEVANSVLNDFADKHKGSFSRDNRMDQRFVQLIPKGVGKNEGREYLSVGIENLRVGSLLATSVDKPTQAFVFSKYAEEKNDIARKWLQRVAGTVTTPKGFESYTEQAGYLFRMRLPTITSAQLQDERILAAFLSKPIRTLVDWWIVNQRQKRVPKAP
jgi:hypothetical protein